MHWKKVQGSIAIFIHMVLRIAGNRFIVSPLKVIYKAFSNPATGSFGWIGDEEAKIIYDLILNSSLTG